MSLSLRNKQINENIASVAATREQKRSTCTLPAVLKLQKYTLGFRETSSLVYANLPFVRIQVAGLPAMHREVLERT